ncbi:MAG: FxLYD domain-containing protein [Candidatus Poribacteria bacterium]
MRKLNTAQKIILIIGLIALAIRCFTYEPIIEPRWERGIIHSETKLNYTIAFHCLGIIAVTSVLMLLAGVFGDRLELYLADKIAENGLSWLDNGDRRRLYLADKRKLLPWVGISIYALVVIGAITWMVYYYLETGLVIQPSEIELFDMRLGPDLYQTENVKSLSGRIKNNSSMKIINIELRILLYDSEGKYIDTDTVTLLKDYETLTPGEVRSFKYDAIFNTSVKYINRWNYEIISVKGRNF